VQLEGLAWCDKLLEFVKKYIGNLLYKIIVVIRWICDNEVQILDILLELHETVNSKLRNEE
jgi:Gpi18-like mannosyltransferase